MPLHRSRPWNVSWGVVASTSVSSSFTPIGASYVDITGLSLTWTPTAGRLYVVTCHLTTVSSTSAALLIVRLTDSANTTFASSQQALNSSTDQAPVTVISPPQSGWAATSRVTKARVYCSAGTGTITATADQPLSLTITDVGPA